MGIVYKILCNETGECYVGSANDRINYLSRKKNHRYQINYCSSKKIIDRGNYEFIILEANIFIDIELRKREQEFIDITENTINEIRAYQSPEHRKEQKRLEHIRNGSERNKLYWEKNKDKLKIHYSQKITCECGGKYTVSNKQVHFKTKKHQDYLGNVGDSIINKSIN